MNPTDEPSELGLLNARNLARFSVIAPHAALLFMCVVGWVREGEYETPTGVVIGVLVIAIMFAMLASGLVAGFIAMWKDSRRGLRETVAIAYLGIFLSGGALLFFGALLVRFVLSS